jgi:hypothetical protein
MLEQAQQLDPAYADAYHYMGVVQRDMGARLGLRISVSSTRSYLSFTA